MTIDEVKGLVRENGGELTIDNMGMLVFDFEENYQAAHVYFKVFFGFNALVTKTTLIVFPEPGEVRGM